MAFPQCMFTSGKEWYGYNFFAMSFEASLLEPLLIAMRTFVWLFPNVCSHRERSGMGAQYAVVQGLICPHTTILPPSVAIILFHMAEYGPSGPRSVGSLYEMKDK